MEFMDVIKNRSAVKKFSGEKITTEQLQAIKDSIIYAPSSLNLQPWKVKIIDDKETLLKLAPYTSGEQVATCSHLFVFCSKKNPEENREKVVKILESRLGKNPKTDNYNNVIKAKMDNMNEQQKVEYSKYQTYMAIQNAWLTAHAVGIGACGLGSFQLDEFRRILNIQDDLEVVLPLAVGIPDYEVRQKFRLDEKDIFF